MANGRNWQTLNGEGQLKIYGLACTAHIRL
jgi:hypothetical protein